MTHLFRGRLIADRELDLSSLPSILQDDLLAPPLQWKALEGALSRLHSEYSKDKIADLLTRAGMGGLAPSLAESVAAAMRPGTLLQRLRDELNIDPVEAGAISQYMPLGVLAHVAAGNMPGIAALSALEGLMTGNINLIKPPGNDGGFTARLLARLCEIEPKFAPYLYVLDIPSGDTPRLKSLLALADGVAVWGSDAAIAGLRAIAPEKTRLIEWGHRYSFAYVTPEGATDAALEAIARDVCETDQLLCSAPQSVLFATEDREELLALSGRFAAAMERVSPQCPSALRDASAWAEITILTQTARALEIAGRQTVFRGDGWSLILDHQPETLRASPLYRTVWLCGVPPKRLAALLFPHRGHLQTVGLAAAREERPGLTRMLLSLGAARVTSPGGMSKGEIGDPRDGQSPLRRYMRRVDYSE